MSVARTTFDAHATSGLRMRALVSNGKTVELQTSFQMPQPSSRDVVIEVRAVGLCRTDLYAVAGKIPMRNCAIPGHEFSGVVATIGSMVNNVSVGQRVAVNPLIQCERCVECERGRGNDCLAAGLMGVDRDGACAEWAAVSEAAIIPIPDDMSWLVAAFVEPMAATLAVLKADIQPEQRGLIFGDNRIAQLTLRVLRWAGFGNVEMCRTEDADKLAENQFEFIVETLATTETLARMVKLLRPRGRIVLKSRQFRPIQLALCEILPKEPIFQMVNYGSFDQAVELLTNRNVIVDDLIGGCYTLEEHVPAFAEAWADEQKKTFLIPRGD